MLVFLAELRTGADVAYAQVSALTMLVLGEFVQVGSARSESMSIFAKGMASNPALLIGSLFSVVTHVAALHWEPTQRLLNLQPLTVESWSMILPLSLAVAVAAELHKRLRGERSLVSP